MFDGKQTTLPSSGHGLAQPADEGLGAVGIGKEAGALEAAELEEIVAAEDTSGANTPGFAEIGEEVAKIEAEVGLLVLVLETG
jgi:hypothetical protein